MDVQRPTVVLGQSRGGASIGDERVDPRDRRLVVGRDEDLVQAPAQAVHGGEVSTAQRAHLADLLRRDERVQRLDVSQCLDAAGLGRRVDELDERRESDLGVMTEIHLYSCRRRG